MHFWREITPEHVDVFTSNYIKAWKFSFKNFNFPFLTLYFLAPKAERVDGEALLHAVAHQWGDREDPRAPCWRSC